MATKKSWITRKEKYGKSGCKNPEKKFYEYGWKILFFNEHEVSEENVLKKMGELI